jgi:ribonuclease HI
MWEDQRGQPMKYVTIATDISCEPKYKITTWACYIRYGGGVIKKSGQFKQYYSNTAKAETYALLNALTIAKKNIPDWNESKVIIHNEIEHVLTPITTKAGNVRQRDVDRTEQIRSIALPILSQALDWERRKIKAHKKDWQHSDNPRKYAINRWCDIESRRVMRAIKQEKKQEIKRLR